MASGRIGPYPRSDHPVARSLEVHHRALVERDGLGLVRDPHPRFGRLPLDREALQLRSRRSAPGRPRAGLPRSPGARRRCSGGTLTRNSMDVPSPSGHRPSAGCPRPSLRWQLWQDRALYSGPSPSDDVVDDGADTHSFRKIPSPTRKSSCWAKVSVAEGCEKALRVAAWREVAAPPGASSSGSGAEKSVGGARRAARSTGLSRPAARQSGRIGARRAQDPRQDRRRRRGRRRRFRRGARRRANATDRRPARRRAGPIVILSATSCPSSPRPACPGCRSPRT